MALLSYNTKSFEYMEHAVCRRGFLLFARDGASLPARCVACNDPVEEPPLATRFAWHDPMLLIFLAAVPPFYLIARPFIVKRGTVSMALCRHHLEMRRTHRLTRWSLLAAGLVMLAVSMVTLIATANVVAYLVVFLVAYALISAAVAYPILAGLVRPYCIEAGLVQLQGVHPAFLNELPDISPPQALKENRSHPTERSMHGQPTSLP